MTTQPRTRVRWRAWAGEWSSQHALLLSVACLMAGIAGGWFIRGGPTVAASNAAKAGVSVATTASAAAEVAPAVRLRQMADAQAAPLLDKLRSDPKNPDLLTNIGNLYYDAQLYPVAIDYYGRALTQRPSDVSVRTDMGTADWYMGNADSAITEFNKALTFAPNSPNTLFNLGLVKWKGMKDGPGALVEWKKLLAVNPKYEAKDKVVQMMAEVQGQSAAGKN